MISPHILDFDNVDVILGASQVALVVKNLPADAGDVRDVGLIPGLGRAPGGGELQQNEFGTYGPWGQR